MLWDNTIEQEQSININNNYLKLEIPKFIHGKGTYIELQLFVSNDTQISRYNIDVRAIYDQGSTVWSAENQWPKWMEDLSGFSFIFIIIWLITFNLIISYLINWIKRIKRKRYYKAYFKVFVEQLLSTRNILKSDLYSTIVFEGLLKNNVIQRKDIKEFLDIPDYIILDNFYITLKQRHKIINSDGDKKIENLYLLFEINKKCLSSLEDAILKIN